MKKFLLFSMMALVAMCGLNSCSEDCDHVLTEHNHSADLVGTWTCMDEDFAEALVISADGSVVSTRLFLNEYRENIKGKIVVENGDVNLTFEDGGNFKSHFDIIPGMAFTIFNEEGERLTYKYCANDLSDEIVGMWVCNDFPTEGESDMMIQTFYENGKCTLTGLLPLEGDSEQVLNEATNYSVIGDLLFIEIPAEKVGGENPIYVVDKLIYTPNGAAYGDILTLKTYPGTESEASMSFLRISQSLNLAGKAYDYNNTYVSNVKGLDEDMTMMGYTFNIGKMEGKNLDKMLKTLLFAVEFPNANTLKYQYHYNGQNLVFEAPIVVDGNKVTIKMSEFSSYYRDVDMYMFQDKDNTQLHMYMPTYAFINYFANMDLAALAFAGEIDVTDEAAVKAIFDRMDERVESINVSFTFKAAK